jgi:hypothetical protein
LSIFLSSIWSPSFSFYLNFILLLSNISLLSFFNFLPVFASLFSALLSPDESSFYLSPVSYLSG